MPICPPKPTPFVCVICERRQDCQWIGSHPPNWPEPPICRFCEGTYGRKNLLPNGSYADRRKLNVGAALQEALHCRASIKEYEDKHCA